MKTELQVTSAALFCGQKRGNPACYLLPEGVHTGVIPGHGDMAWDNLYIPCSISPEALETTRPYDENEHGLGVIFASVILDHELPSRMKHWGLNKKDVLDILEKSRITKEEILTASAGME
jgi:hypothetical protein